MTTTGTRSSSLGAFLEDTGCRQATTSEESQFSSFQEYVELAASGTETRASTGTTDTGSAETSNSEASSETETEQISQNGTQTLAGQLSSAVSLYPATGTGTASTGETAAQDPSISAVRNAMVEAGLDPDSVEITYHTEDVWCPGGGWVNEMLLVETSDGRSLDFSARLSERSPEVTVCDVRHMLEGTMGWAALS